MAVYTRDELIAYYGYWQEHPKHCFEDWQIEVANNNTRQDYWTWVETQIILHESD